MRTILLGLVAATALATPALAQDVNPAFTGFRVGALAGYDGIRPGSSEDSDLDGDNETVNGLLYGADVGYDFALSGILVGVEGEYTGSTGKVETERTNPNFFGFGRVSTGRDLYVGARAGILAAPETLVYVKGGYTNARLNVLASDGTTDSRENFELDGYRLGAGVEQALGTRAYAKLEYRYSNYSQADFQFRDGATTSNFDIDTDRHQVVAGVGIRF
jgi:outer membrane immunogenic protein